MKKKAYTLSGIDCANCALKIEDALNKLNGVYTSNLSFMTQKLIILFDEEVLNEEKIESTIKRTIYGVRITSKTELSITPKDIEESQKPKNKVKRIIFGKKKR